MSFNPLTKTVDTLAELRTFKGMPGSAVKVTVLGYSAPGDGGGGDFYWNDTSIAPDNDGVIIQVTGVATGRWIRTVIGNTINVQWFGAKPDRVTDNTVALNNCAAYLRSVYAVIRLKMYFPEGDYLTGPVLMSGIFDVEGANMNTTIRGLPGMDILYWPNAGEANYIVPTNTQVRNLRFVVNATVDVTANYLRIGLSGERIGNVALHFPACQGINFDALFITVSGQPSINDANGTCAIFFAGPGYKVNFGTKVEIRDTDYGVVTGTSELHLPMLPITVTPNPDNLTFNAANTYTTTSQVALVFDINEGDVTGFIPRQRYYVVNPTPVSFQLAATVGGPPIPYAIVGAPLIYAIPAGASTVEYACDEWAALHLITVCKKVGFCVTNLYQSTFNTFGCQSRTVSVRVLNYQSRNRNRCWYVKFNEMYTEGPLFTAYMTGKEYVRIEGEYIIMQSGPFCNSGTRNYITLNTDRSIFNIVQHTGTNYLRVLGNGNHIRSSATNKELDVFDLGAGNDIIVMWQGNGSDARRYDPYIAQKSLPNNLGGNWPDYILDGNQNSPYQSRNVLYYPAISQVYANNPPITYLFDDPTIELPGYVRISAATTLSVRYPLGNNKNNFAMGRFFPRSRWRLYAKVRTFGAPQNLTLFFQRLDGTGFGVETAFAVSTGWQIISIELDHSTAPIGMYGQIGVRPATGGFDLAWFVVAPYAGELFALKHNYGNNLIDTAGNDAPEGLVAAAPASTYRQYNGTVWVKLSGTDAAGWRALNAFRQLLYYTDPIASTDITKAWLNTSYATALPGDEVVFTNVTDLPANVISAVKYNSTEWYINNTLSKAV